MTPADKARAIAKSAARLAAAYDRGNKRLAMLEELFLCNDVIDMIDDGDCMAQRESLMDELRCDETGDPVDAFGNSQAGSWAA